MKTTEIYVITHKRFQPLAKDSCYKPLHVGLAPKGDESYQSDNTGDNISAKNPNYCELTGMYWIWKNTNPDIVGIEHYRRYFVTLSGYLRKFILGGNSGFLTEKQIRKDLVKHDAIVGKDGYIPFSKKNLVEGYDSSHHVKDILETLKIIKEKYPDYTQTVDDVFSKRAFQPANMIICKKELFDDYCTWLFSILEELEKRIDISDYTAYQKRVYGFIAERIFRVYLLQNKLKLKKRHIINTEDGNAFKILAKELKRFNSITKSEHL